MTLAKACELCPEEEPDDQDAPDEHESPPPEDALYTPIHLDLSISRITTCMDSRILAQQHIT